MELVFPVEKLEAAALDYRQEHFDNGQHIVNGSALLDKSDSYSAWLRQLKNY